MTTTARSISTASPACGASMSATAARRSPTPSYEQMNELPYYNTFFGTTTPPTALLAQKITSHAGPNINHVFFTGSGSEANDTWFRMARVYWAAIGKPTKKMVIARAQRLSRLDRRRRLARRHEVDARAGRPADRRASSISASPIGTARAATSRRPSSACKMARELEAKIDELGEDNVAAFVAEPIQGAGGVIVPPETYWPEIARICKARNILLVADEVICGFGRTGTLVRPPAFRRRARSGADRQGSVLRLPADRRRAGQRSRRPTC